MAWFHRKQFWLQNSYKFILGQWVSNWYKVFEVFFELFLIIMEAPKDRIEQNNLKTFFIFSQIYSTYYVFQNIKKLTFVLIFTFRKSSFKAKPNFNDSFFNKILIFNRIHTHKFDHPFSLYRWNETNWWCL